MNAIKTVICIECRTPLHQVNFSDTMDLSPGNKVEVELYCHVCDAEIIEAIIAPHEPVTYESLIRDELKRLFDASPNVSRSEIAFFEWECARRTVEVANGKFKRARSKERKTNAKLFLRNCIRRRNVLHKIQNEYNIKNNFTGESAV